VVFSVLTPQLRKDTHFIQNPGDLGDLQVLSIRYGIYLHFTFIRHSYPIFLNSFFTLIYFHPFFLGAFAKLRKATISFVVSVRLSVLPHGTTRLSMDVLS